MGRKYGSIVLNHINVLNNADYLMEINGLLCYKECIRYKIRDVKFEKI